MIAHLHRCAYLVTVPRRRRDPLHRPCGRMPVVQLTYRTGDVVESFWYCDQHRRGDPQRILLADEVMELPL